MGVDDAVVTAALARLTPNALAQTEVTPTLRAVLAASSPSFF